jgi:hypothetical protein
MAVLAAAWNAPWVARQFVYFPLGTAWAVVSFGLAMAALLAWFIPGLHRAVFVPSAAERGTGGQVAAAAVGFVAAGLFLLLLGLLGALAILE